MRYDFITTTDRSGTGSIKWNNMKRKNPDIPAGIVPFSAADMEFVPPPELVKGLKEYLDHMIFGYTCGTDAYYDAVTGWARRRHGYFVERDWIVERPGIVPAIYEMVERFTEPEDSVLILSPGYHPFADAVRTNGRKLIESLLVIHHDTYEINFQDLGEKLSSQDVTMMIFCNPQNPGGRVWTKEEVETVCRLCLENHVYLISDEIHCDLILPGYHFTSVANLDEKYLLNCAVCTAPSKTFNLAGFQVSNIIIRDERYRNKMRENTSYTSLNVMAYKACEIVYNDCEGWLDELLTVIAGNFEVLKKFMAENFPMVHVFELQGTYLAWMDFRKLGLHYAELEKQTNETGLIFSQGYGFGTGGEGFERMNLACPMQALQKGLMLLKDKWNAG